MMVSDLKEELLNSLVNPSAKWGRRVMEHSSLFANGVNRCMANVPK